VTLSLQQIEKGATKKPANLATTTPYFPLLFENFTPPAAEATEP